jgi:hypothetical protein
MNRTPIDLVKRKMPPLIFVERQQLLALRLYLKGWRYCFLFTSGTRWTEQIEA